MSRLETDPSRMLCYCLGVRYGKVVHTIREHGCAQVADVTRRCKAGGGCRSCHPEIEELMDEIRKQIPARGFMARLGRLFGRRHS